MKAHLLAVLTLAIAGTATLAQAQDNPQDGWSLSLGAAAIYRPEFKGSKEYEGRALPFVGLRYSRGDLYVSVEGPSLRANLLPIEGLEAGPIVAFERGRDDDIKNLAVRRLGEIDGAITAGAFVRKRFDLAGGRLALGAEAMTDTGEVHEGTLARLNLSYDRAVNSRWSLGANLSTTWADRNYMQTYYGVTTAGATASGMSRFTADGGIENVTFGAALRYRFSDHWGALAHGGYTRLVDSAADSPIVARQGSADQGQFALALFYSF